MTRPERSVQGPGLKEHMWRTVGFLFALSASLSLFICLYGLVSASQLPPGAVLHYDALANGCSADGLTPDETLFCPFISFTAQVLNLDFLTALKLIPTFLLSALPLLAYSISLTVTGSRLVSVAAAWILAFTPAVTTSLIVGNYGLILGLFLFTAYLSFLVRCLKRGSRAAPCLALLASVFALPLSFLLILGSPGTQGRLFGVNLESWAESLWLSLSMVVGVAIGIYTLSKRADKAALPMLLALAVAPFALALIPALSSLPLLSTPILALLAASPLLWIRESCLVREVDAAGHSPVTEVVVDLPKLAAVFLVAIFTVSTVAVGYGASASMQREYLASRRFTDEEITSAAKWIGESMPSGAVLSSRPVVAAWLEALSGKKFTGPGGLVSETVESTSFRLLTPSLLVDEWEPFSASRSPCVSYYDGRGYEPMVFIDDSYVRVGLIKEGEEWVESPHGAAYRGYQWLSETHPELVLVQHFESHGLFFEKKIRVSASEPRVRVEYRVDPKTDVKVVSLELPVWVEPGKEKRILETTSERTTLIIDGRETKISFLGNSVNTTQVESSEGNAMVKAEFGPVGGFIEAGVRVSIKSGERSEMPLWTAHTPELIKSHNIEYVVAEAGAMGFLDRSLVDHVKSLTMRDSFNRILFETLGTKWVEAPSSGRVLFDETPTDGVRLIGYETDGLLINKTLTKSDGSVDVRYAVAPIETSSSLVSMNLTVWVPWDVVLLDYELQGNVVKLNLGFGEIEVGFVGNLMGVEVGPDPEFGQNVVHAMLGLGGEDSEVGVNISSPKPLHLEYEATTRPVMEADDRLSVFVDTNMFKVVFRQGALVVCQTNP